MVVLVPFACARIHLKDIDLDQPLDSIVQFVLRSPQDGLPAVVDPCDMLAFRSAREMETRHQTLKDVWETRTLEFQPKQSAKRVKISHLGDTFVEVVHNQPKEKVVKKTLATYF